MPIKILGLLVVGSVIFAACNPTADQANNNQVPTQPAQAQPAVDADQIVEKDDAMTKSNPGSYTDYSQAASLAAAESGHSLLFFHASWCPTCRAADKEITSNADQIPAGLTIFKTDFDTESELKTKYNVVGQHTYVQIDADGNEITKWNGGGLADIEENIQI